MNSFAFNYVMTLASVINALGIVRWIVRLSEYLQRRESLKITFSWTFLLLAAHQFLLHVLLWWMLWGIRDATNFYYLTYLYMLLGPILLFLGTSLMTPEIVGDEIDFSDLYYGVRPMYSTTLALVWAWALFVRPVFQGELAPSTVVLVLYLLAALAIRVARSRTANFALAAAHWILFVVYLSLFGVNVAGPAAAAT